MSYGGDIDNAIASKHLKGTREQETSKDEGR